MKIIITGATGAFGGAMTRYFSKAGHEVIATGRMKNPPAELLKYANYHRADICKPIEFPEADICIHGAALSDDKASMKQLHLPNIIGTQNVIRATEKCSKFIFISSSSVYLPEVLPIIEEIAGKQNNKMLSPYGHSKLLSEKVVHENFKGEQAFILRPRAFYGPGDTQIIPRMLKLVRKDFFNKPGAMEIDLSMTHYDNIAHAIDCCIQSELTGIRTYNVADDKVYLMIDVLRELFTTLYEKRLSEKEIKIGLLKLLAFFRIGGFTPLLVRALTQNMVLDISKIKSELNYKPQHEFFSSLNEIKNWIDSIGGIDKLIEPQKGICWK